MLSCVSEVAVYTGRQLGFSSPQMRMTTISSRSRPSAAPSRRKLWPGRSGAPCGERLGLARAHGSALGPGRGRGAHLVGQAGQQVEHKVAHPLQELLQRLERVHVQHELLRLEVDHDLVDV